MSGQKSQKIAAKRLYCNQCQNETNHTCKGEHFTNNEYHEYAESVLSRLWICDGCESATLEVTGIEADIVPLKDTNKIRWEELYVTFYPKRSARHAHYKKFVQFPKILNGAYIEVLESYNNELPVLCSIGLRALLEGICRDKGISDKVAWTLPKKIDELAKLQHLPPAIAKNLQSYKFMGDDAAHYLEAPDRESLKVGIEVMEDLINYLYVLEHKSEQLNKLVSDNQVIRRKRE